MAMVNISRVLKVLVAFVDKKSTKTVGWVDIFSIQITQPKAQNFI